MSHSPTSRAPLEGRKRVRLVSCGTASGERTQFEHEIKVTFSLLIVLRSDQCEFAR